MTEYLLQNLGVIKEDDQRNVYALLAREGYNGVLAVHCEKESELDAKLWIPERPITHCHARPEKAEIESVGDQLRFAKDSGYNGKLHIAHISSPKAVDLVAKAKEEGQDASCGVCPHHFIFDWSKMYSPNGIRFKMNPPLRAPESRDLMFQYLKEGKIDWIETDHAPHSLKEKDAHPFMSGIPGIASWPLFVEYLRKHEFTEKQIGDLTFNNAAKRFNLDIQRNKRPNKDRTGDYPFNPYEVMEKEVGWK